MIMAVAWNRRSGPPRRERLRCYLDRDARVGLRAVVPVWVRWSPALGNLTDDPDVRVTPNGTAVANLTVATTARRNDRQACSWVDGDTTYVKLVVWNEQAETVADSLRRGLRVIVPGSLDAADV
jgi:Single-strand binding protein family